MAGYELSLFIWIIDAVYLFDAKHTIKERYLLGEMLLKKNTKAQQRDFITDTD